MTAVFYPPPMPQGTVPPYIHVPIVTAPPPPDNPPAQVKLQERILALWDPQPLYRFHFTRPLFPILGPGGIGDLPPVQRQDTLSKIISLWYPAFVHNQQRPSIIGLLPVIDTPPLRQPDYRIPLTWHTQTYHVPHKKPLYTPGILSAPLADTFQVNVHIYDVRHAIQIDVNNNRELQNVNQGSTFIFTITAISRVRFPREVEQVDAITLSIKDSLGNLPVSSDVAQKQEGTFTYTYQLASDAPLGPWSIQCIASSGTRVRVTPYAIAFIVI
jgi:hypothetical protein